MGARSGRDAEVVVAMTTVRNMEQARALAGSLVESRLAACVSLLPEVRSLYRWKGDLVEDPEIILWIKTRWPLVPKLKEAIRQHHPYEVPELLILPVQDGLPEYLSWIRQSTEDADTEVQ